ncbi:NINE protein [Corynebacterium glucuronolyticum]|nr:NINE protein [Corynebacterium glucuronolyticum]
MNNPYGFSQDVSPISDKNWIVAALLLAFVGGLGVHNFYLGKTNYGIGQLVLNIAGWGLFVSILGIPFALASWGILSVWLFIEFLILVINGGTDGYGRPMRP